MWWSLVATTTSYAGALGSLRVQWWSNAEMSLATWAPPVTGSDPPSQKSFWTSTTMRACFMGRRLLVALEARLDHRVALGELASDEGQLGAGALVALAGRLERLAAGRPPPRGGRDE